MLGVLARRFAHVLRARTTAHARFQADHQRALVLRARAGAGELGQVEGDSANFISAAAALVNLQQREQQRIGLETRVLAPNTGFFLRRACDVRRTQRVSRQRVNYAAPQSFRRRTSRSPRQAAACGPGGPRGGLPHNATRLVQRGWHVHLLLELIGQRRIFGRVVVGVHRVHRARVAVPLRSLLVGGAASARRGVRYAPAGAAAHLRGKRPAQRQAPRRPVAGPGRERADEERELKLHRLALAAQPERA